jgi:hypothetical protein
MSWVLVSIRSLVASVMVVVPVVVMGLSMVTSARRPAGRARANSNATRL